MSSLGVILGKFMLAVLIIWTIFLALYVFWGFNALLILKGIAKFGSWENFWQNFTSQVGELGKKVVKAFKDFWDWLNSLFKG